MTTNYAELIKDKLSILDVVGSYVKLEKAGKDWKGKSPFTNEKTPSFFVSPDKGFFYCFSSGKGGDMFTFIQEMERVEFKDALKILAEKAGVTLDEAATVASPDAKLYTLLDDATKWYEVNLRKNEEVVAYLVGRGLSKESIAKFRLGFAKDSWDDLYGYLKKRGYRDEQIFQAGLSVSRDGGGYYDRFRSRIMFPIKDARGRVVGFSGRIFTDDPTFQGGKYINSPEGPLFDKSRVLYGYDTAKQAIAKESSCILVEGQLDVLLAQQSGSLNTVAVSGTGLTDGHLDMIKRFADTLYLSFDADAAGIKATRRSILKAFEHGMKVKVIILPLGKDPADVIKEHPSQWQLALADARDYIDYRIEIFNREHPGSSFEERHHLITQDLFDFVYLIPSAVVQDRMLQLLAQFLGVALDSLRNDFTKHQIDDDVLSLRLIPQENQPESVSGDEPRNNIIGLSNYLREYHQPFWDTVFSHVEEIVSEVYGESLTNLTSQLSSATCAMLTFKFEQKFDEEDHRKAYLELEDLLTFELVKKLRTEAASLLTELRTKEYDEDIPAIKQLQYQHHHLIKRIDELTTPRN